MIHVLRFTICALLTAAFVLPAAAQHAMTDGSIVESMPCPLSAKRTYDQYVRQQKTVMERENASAAAEGFRFSYAPNAERFLLSREEFEKRETFADFDCEKIKYLSDGLRVVGFIWKPKNIADKKLPLVIVNRGGNANFSLLTPESFYFPFVSNGFVVIGSQYRGADGGDGHDEFGGADVNDVLNLLPLARSLPYVDMSNIFMYGESRGGMQTFLALKKGMNVNAVAVTGALIDLGAAGQERRSMHRVWNVAIPGFASRPDELMQQRSVLNFADKIQVPVLILQGEADWRANSETQAKALAERLRALGKPHELHVFPDDDHPVSIHRLERERRIIGWFRKHMR